MTTRPDEDTDTQGVRYLHHYTSTDGLMGICEQRKIRATKLGFLNDGGELEYGLAYARELLQEEARRATTSNAQSLLSLRDELEAWSTSNIFACSFTESGDDLSQWRGYGTFSQAYSLAFDASALGALNLRSQAHWRLVNCVYNSTEQESQITNTIANYMAGTSPTPPERNATARTLVEMAATFKHESFRAEKESRLICEVLDEGTVATPVFYRRGAYSLIPFVEVDLLVDTLKAVTVGPTSQLPLSVTATAGYLRQLGMSIPVYSTTTTFREW